MISDEERREVARKLRDWTWKSAPPECLLNQLAFGDDCPGTDDDPDAIDCHQCEAMAANRLADLIEPGEPEVKCVAEVKIDGERLEQLVHDAAVELAGIDRDALLKMADELDKEAEHKESSCWDRSVATVGTRYVREISRQIREALGESE